MADHYAILGLESRRLDGTLTAAQIRKAYHDSLLAHHPDKDSSRGQDKSPTVDDIKNAFEILSHPLSKAEYDETLRTMLQRKDNAQRMTSFTGLEVADLEDLIEHPEISTWTRSCRCGDNEGFVVTEENLEADAMMGEVVIGCRGCSLWLKVLYQATQEPRGTDQTSCLKTESM